MEQPQEQPQQGQGQGQAPPAGAGAAPQQRQGIVGLLTSQPSSTVLFVARIASVVFSVLFLVSTGFASLNNYRLALKMGTLSSAIRLYQRVADTPPSLTLQFFRTLLLEDSFHYVLYTILLLGVKPSLVFLSPVAIFAFFHSTIFLRKLLTASNVGVLQRLVPTIGRLDTLATSGFVLVAKAELFIFFIIVFQTVTMMSGKYLVALAAYPQFMLLRYFSRRNPHFRTVVAGLEQTLDGLSRSPSCPAIVARAYGNVKALVIKVAGMARGSLQ
eukprot:m.483166 g.483166  ORF g.483166 m.483166 type:complete len:272 (-) comp22802_c0_seq1:127-942(-)